MRDNSPAHRLDLFEGLLAVALFGMAGTAIYYGVATVYIAFPGLGGTDFGMTLPASDAPAPVKGVLAPGVAAMEAHLEVTIRDTGLGVTGGLLYLLTWLPGVLTGLLALWWLLRIVGGRAESAALIHGLRRTGWVLVLGSLTAYVLGSLARSVLAYLVFTGGGLFAPSAFSVVALVTGVAALAIAEIVERNAGQEREADLMPFVNNDER